MNNIQNTRDATPEIGAPFHGGIYAGLTLHDNTPFHLVLFPEEFTGPWTQAKAWAELAGRTLPSRIDALVLFQSLKSELKPEWHWTENEYAGLADYAWLATFTNGNQSVNPKSYDYRARAVRRVAI